MKLLNLIAQVARDRQRSPLVSNAILFTSFRLCYLYSCKNLLGGTAFNPSKSVTTAIYKTKPKPHVLQINCGKLFQLIDFFDVVCASHNLTPSVISLLVISANLLVSR